MDPCILPREVVGWRFTSFISYRDNIRHEMRQTTKHIPWHNLSPDCFILTFYLLSEVLSLARRLQSMYTEKKRGIFHPPLLPIVFPSPCGLPLFLSGPYIYLCIYYIYAWVLCGLTVDFPTGRKEMQCTCIYVVSCVCVWSVCMEGCLVCFQCHCAITHSHMVPFLPDTPLLPLPLLVPALGSKCNQDGKDHLWGLMSRMISCQPKPEKL